MTLRPHMVDHMSDQATIWVFHGEGGHFASGVFSTRERADAWIRTHRLSGTLTAYPLDEGCYDWAMRHDLVTGRARTRGDDPAFVGSFTTAHQQHRHYVDGIAAH